MINEFITECPACMIPIGTMIIAMAGITLTGICKLIESHRIKKKIKLIINKGDNNV